MHEIRGWLRRGAREARRPRPALAAVLLVAAIAGFCGAARLAADAPPAAETRFSNAVRLVALLWDRQPEAAARSLEQLAGSVRGGSLSAETAQRLSEPLAEGLAAALADPGDARFMAAVELAALWQEPAALEAAQRMAGDVEQPIEVRREALRILTAAHPAAVAEILDQTLEQQNRRGEGVDPAWLREVLEQSLATGDAQLVERVIGAIDQLPAGAAGPTIERLTQRAEGGRALLAAISRGDLPKDRLNLNQVRRLAEASPEHAQQVAAIWGQIRSGDRAARQAVIDEVAALTAQTPGDPHRGWPVFDRACGQCHLLHGRGHDVGPDLTSNGRGSFDQLLSNIFDPSLVIGPAYQAVTVLTDDGRVLTGLVTEESERRIVLKIQGGQTEAVRQDEIEEVQRSEQSLMPEGLEEQLSPQEIADLMALLTLQRPPESEENTIIAGTPPRLHEPPSRPEAAESPFAPRK